MRKYQPIAAKLSIETLDAGHIEATELIEKALEDAFKAGRLEGLDEGERAQCRKCYNRGYEDGARLGEQDEDTCSAPNDSAAGGNDGS